MKTIKVTNRAGRPIWVRIGIGQTLRLGPRETSAELPAHCARAPELRALCAKGVLAVLDTEPTRAPSAATTEGASAERHDADQGESKPRDSENEKQDA